MDLLQTVRKEGSRGGVDFKWEDVRSSNHRENYLGHSLMAPVGRWQKNRDLNWYARAGDAEKTPEEIAAEEEQRRREEVRKVKEAEEDAMARALGLPVPDRSANTEPLGESRIPARELNTVLKDVLAEDGSSKQGGGGHAQGHLQGDKQLRRHHTVDETVRGRGKGDEAEIVRDQEMVGDVMSGGGPRFVDGVVYDQGRQYGGGAVEVVQDRRHEENVKDRGLPIDDGGLDGLVGWCLISLS